MNVLNKKICIRSTLDILLHQWYIRNAFMNELSEIAFRK
jgi:hypothetical protein